MGLMVKVVFALWSTACASVLAITLWTYSPGPNSDIGGLFVWAMLALTFPLGLIVAALVAAVVALSESATFDPMSYVPNLVGFTLLWLAFYAVGYWQWFRVIPWLWRHISSSRRGA